MFLRMKRMHFAQFFVSGKIIPEQAVLAPEGIVTAF
jgi:hypothetical protein